MPAASENTSFAEVFFCLNVFNYPSINKSKRLRKRLLSSNIDRKSGPQY
ncbi:hypothetical protein CAter282_1423 [Collimonas arenae]|uniref:Uncharacterized protein n=1 Tax=Collimonas arenae TaxID=279058 RepID=A0A127QHY1_9BURK|nr:hypothetical protein CAter10_1541 [Collimonas arenae]AMP09212.1 hypothetical protein CAter282_1423 [Collimonas arenae]